ncbi:ribosomal protein S1 [Chthonomonas calidirosea]|uniref:30S ribosomal protein S1 n=1 Tax=Chthonomonas calidirosea TaxID=454171 RepID=UPI0006DD4CBA|nr:S1 RNA-binding domain-containing protein [Chthonomonas calidirosea]CEK16373.1 ribosomal protein S1 [Chthonomonas calidirosea]
MSDETVQERTLEVHAQSESEEQPPTQEGSLSESSAQEALTSAVVSSETTRAEEGKETTSQPPEPPASPAAEVSSPTEDIGTDYASSFRELRKGDIIQGVVMRIDREEVLVDVGAKSEGIIPLNELSRQSHVPPETVVSVGERIWVYVLEPENDFGNPILSKRRADLERTWVELKQAQTTGTNIEGKVVAHVKGGLQVTVGLQGVVGFVPASHVGLEGPRVNLERYVGKTIPLKVLEVDRAHKKVILSNRLVVEEERRRRLEEAKASIQPGQIRRGVVRRLTNYGAFVDLGGIDGLLHISEMSWSRLNHPRDVLREGQEIDVFIIKVDFDQERVSLSLRRTQPDPWEKVATIYREGDVLTGTVTRVIDSGAFVQLEEGIEGYLPNSEMVRNSSGRITPPAVGEEITVKLLKLRLDERKMTLSQRAAVPVEPVIEEPPPPPPAEPAAGKRKRSKKRGRRSEEDEDYGPYAGELEEQPLNTLRDAFKAARRRARKEESGEEEILLDEEIDDVSSEEEES